MKVLDLFAGLGGWSQAFKDNGHEVFTVDLDTRFDVDLHKDIFDLKVRDIPWHPDIVLASPPCEKFSVMTIGRNWNLDNTPKTKEAAQAKALVEYTLVLIKLWHPTWWLMENPRGKLRKLDIMNGFERRSVTYCQLGERFMKPTDLWGVFPPSLELPKPCKNGAPCHVSAARSSITGVQGRNRSKFRGGMIEDMASYMSWSNERKELSALRAKIPYELSRLVCEAAQRDYDTNTV